MTPLDAFGAAAAHSGGCERCLTSAGEVRWSGELGLSLCFDCFGAPEEPVVECGHLKWPRCGRLNWPHLRPICR